MFLIFFWVILKYTRLKDNGFLKALVVLGDVHPNKFNRPGLMFLLNKPMYVPQTQWPFFLIHLRNNCILWTALTIE